MHHHVKDRLCDDGPSRQISSALIASGAINAHRFFGFLVITIYRCLKHYNVLKLNIVNIDTITDKTCVRIDLCQKPSDDILVEPGICH